MNKVHLFASPTHARHLNPVVGYAGDLLKLVLPGPTFSTLEEVCATLYGTVHSQNEGRKTRGKRFPDTVRT